MKPLPLEHDGSLNNAIDFVKETSHLVSDSDKILAELTNSDDKTMKISTAQDSQDEKEEEVKDAE